MTKICYVDFDGVTHDDAVYWSRREGIFMVPQEELCSSGFQFWKSCLPRTLM